MNEFDIPIYRKAYDLYKLLCEYRETMSRKDQYTIWKQTELHTLELIRLIARAIQTKKELRISIIEETSVVVSMLRGFIRLMKDTKALDIKKYIILQSHIDELGRQIGGWLRSTKEA